MHVNLEIMLHILRIWKMHANLATNLEIGPEQKLCDVAIVHWFRAISRLHTLVCNLKIGMQFPDCENAQCNLKIAQIPRLHRTHSSLGQP